jgi:hypothetical protein
MLHYDPMLGALDPSWCVIKVGGDSPERYKQPTPLWQAVITGCRALATRTAPPDSTMRLYHDLNRLRFALAATQEDFAVNKSDKMLHPIQEGLNLELNS